METEIREGFIKLCEDAVEAAEEFTDEIWENETAHALDEFFYPMVYANFAIYSTAVTHWVRSAGAMLPQDSGYWQTQRRRLM